MSEAYTLMHIPVRLVPAVQALYRDGDTLTPAEAAALARIGEGWVMVPKEPSEEEWDRIAEMCCAIPGSLWQERAMVLWPELISAASMLTAAPEADSHD